MKLVLCKSSSQSIRTKTKIENPIELISFTPVQHRRYQVREAGRCYRKTLQGKLRHMYDNARCCCADPDHKNYKDYGGRGIRFCFPDFESFHEYCTVNLDISTVDKLKRLRLSRIDVNGNFCRGNIQFVDCSDSIRKQRKRSTHCDKKPTSMFKGVSLNRRNGKYRATITINGKAKHLGLFIGELQAAITFDTYCRAFFPGAATNETLGIINKWLDENELTMSASDFLADLKFGRKYGT